MTSGDAHDGRVTLDTDDGVALVTISRVRHLNTFTQIMFDELADHSRRIADDPTIRVAVITGEGDRAFSAGGDLDSLLPSLKYGVNAVTPVADKRFFSDVYKPVIAAVRGVCIGGGLEVMLGTDMRIASSDARFGLGEVRWGLIPGGGSHVRLPDQIPWAIAMQMLLTGEPISAQRAHEIGLINEVREASEVLGYALDLAERVSRNGPVAVQTAKEIAVRARSHELGFKLEAALNDRVLASQDAIEGPKAFVEKRTPQFGGI